MISVGQLITHDKNLTGPFSPALFSGCCVTVHVIPTINFMQSFGSATICTLGRHCQRGFGGQVIRTVLVISIPLSKNAKDSNRAPLDLGAWRDRRCKGTGQARFEVKEEQLQARS